MPIMNAGLKEYIIDNYCKKYDIDASELEFLAENDTTLHFHEQSWKEALLPLVKDDIKRAELQIEINGIQDEEVEQWNNERYSSFVDEEREKALERLMMNEGIKTTEKFKPIVDLTKMVARKHSCGVIIVVEGGISKTFSILKTLKQELKSEEFTRINSYSTPLELYRILYHNRDKKVIVFDDVHNIWRNKLMVSILKNALDTTTNRIVQYNTTSDKCDVPASFKMNAGLIIVSNTLKVKDADVNAVVSRCHFFEVALTHFEKLSIMKEIAEFQEKGFIVEWLIIK